MTKQEWEDAYLQLKDLRSELAVLEQEYRHGSNKKKRDDANRRMGYVKHRVQHVFDTYHDVYIIASGGDGNSDYGRAITMDEFFQSRYIVGDIGSLLEKIQEKIKSFDRDITRSKDEPRPADE